MTRHAAPPHAAPPPAPSGRRLRHLLMVGGAALVATGLGWLALHDWWPMAGPFGPQPRPAAAWLLRAHGVIAWALAAVGGAVWQSHVRTAWRVEWRRWTQAGRARAPGLRAATGLLAAAGLAVLLATAAGLQYAPEGAHAALSWIHWLTGVVAAAAGLAHYLARRRHGRHPGPR